MKVLCKILKILKPKSIEEYEYEWLANSTDLVDLERKQRLLFYGKSPFRNQNLTCFKGYI